MSNRTKVLERADVSVHADCLDALLDSCRRNGRRAIMRKPEPKIYFDVDRFRWYFKNLDGKNLQYWRDQIDEMMRKEGV